MKPQGPRIFTLNPQSFGAGKVGMSQASPFKRFILVLVLILIAIPVLALGMVMLLILITLALFKALFQTTGRASPQPADRGRTPAQPTASNSRSAASMSRNDDSLRENVKVIER